MINWLRIRDWAENRHHEQHMANYHHDRRCQNCDRWHSCTGYAQNVRDIDLHVQTTECASCHYVSEWFMSAMIPIPMRDVRRAEETGKQINIIKDY